MPSKKRGKKRDQPNHNLALKLNQTQLDEIQHDIDILNGKLSALQVKRDDCEKEIRRIQASVAPINRVPEYVLSEIFELLVIPEDRSRGPITSAAKSRTNLLLVCKHFNTILTTTPSLHRLIFLTNPHTGTMSSRMEWLRAQKSWLELHLSRAKEVHLDVVIHFWGVLLSVQYATDDIEELFPDCSQDDDMMQWIEDIPWEGFYMNEDYRQLYVDTVQTLIGEDGAYMKRWQSLEISLPADRFLAARIWRLLNHPPPNLTRMLLSGRLNSESYLPQDQGVLPYLDSLTELQLSYEFRLESIPSCPHVLKFTAIVNLDTYSWTELQLLSRFPAITDLFIIVVAGGDSISSKLDPIHLPDLKNLQLQGPVPEKVMKALKINKLANLTIKEHYIAFEFIPESQVFSVAKSVMFEDQFSHDQDELQQFLFEILSQSHIAQLIEIPSELASVALPMIKDLRSDGQLQELKTLTTRHGDGVLCTSWYPPFSRFSKKCHHD